MSRPTMGPTSVTVTMPELRSPAARARSFLRLVMIQHSVFALPFAYLAVFAAMLHGHQQASVDWSQLALVTVAMVAARTFAMAVNRVVDRELDARNPRTAGRELVTGAVSVRGAAVGAMLSVVVFLAAAAALSRLCLLLSPLALLLLGGYPYGKRFTWLCHGMLGLAQAAAPVGAWIAVTNRWSWAALALGLAVGLWIGGFDIIYALQDIEVDRANGLHSIPARFGPRVALAVSAGSHVVTVGLLCAFGVLEGFGTIWYVGIIVVSAALGYEHAIVRPNDMSRVNRAFFTTNGFVGIALFAFGLADMAHRGLSG